MEIKMKSFKYDASKHLFMINDTTINTVQSAEYNDLSSADVRHMMNYIAELQGEVKELTEELNIAIEAVEESGVDYDEVTEHLRNQ